MAEKKTAKKAAEVKEEVKAAGAKAEKAVKAAAKTTKAAAAKATKAVKDAPAKAKAAAKPAAKKAAGAKETADKIVKGVKAPIAKAKAAKLEVVIQSPMGGNITPEEIAAKLPEGAETVFVRVDQNKLWWIKGEETGSVDIW